MSARRWSGSSEGGEVAAGRHLRVVHEVVGGFDPVAGRLQDLPREGGEAGRDGDALNRRDAAADAFGAGLVVDAGSRRDAVGRPIEHDVGEQGVLRVARLDIAVAVAPGAELLRDPGGDTGGGVGLGDAEGLRLRALDVAVAGLLRLEGATRGEPGLVRLRGRIGGTGEGHVQVDAAQVAGVGGAQTRADDGAPVAALRAVALVAELGGHEVVERIRDAGGAPAPLAWLAAPAEAGDGGDDDVEGVGGIAAMGGGVGEGADEVEELEDGAGPAVRQDERVGIGAVAADVPEVDIDAVDLAEELGPGVERGLLGAPVVLVAPVVAKLANVGDVSAVVPAGVGNGVVPAGAVEAIAEVVEDGVGDVDAEGSWRHAVTIGRAVGRWLLAVGGMG